MKLGEMTTNNFGNHLGNNSFAFQQNTKIQKF